MKTTIDAQLDYIRYDIKGLENRLKIFEDPKSIAEYEKDLEMCRAIEQTLIEIKEKNQPKDTCTTCGQKSDRLITEWVQEGKQMIGPGERLCQKCSMNIGFKTLREIHDDRARAQVNSLDDNKGSYEFKNPVRGAGDDYPLFKWPGVGDSVMVLVDYKGKTEWVDAYVTESLHHQPGVHVKTFWGQEMVIANINLIQMGQSEKGVQNG